MGSITSHPTKSSYQVSPSLEEATNVSRKFRNDNKNSFISWWKKLLLRLSRPSITGSCYDDSLNQSRIYTSNLHPDDNKDFYDHMSESAHNFFLYFPTKKLDDNSDLTSNRNPSQDVNIHKMKRVSKSINLSRASSYTSATSDSSPSTPYTSSDCISDSANQTECDGRYNSRSPALPLIRSRRSSFECTSNDVDKYEDDEITIAQAEVMYARATWRMYERITQARAAAAIAKQHSAQRFVVPAPAPTTGTTSIDRQQSQLAFVQVPNNIGTSSTDDEIPESYLYSRPKEESCEGDYLSKSIDTFPACFEMDQ